MCASGPGAAMRHTADFSLPGIKLNDCGLHHQRCATIISKNESSLQPNGDEYLYFIPSYDHPNSASIFVSIPCQIQCYDQTSQN